MVYYTKPTCDGASQNILAQGPKSLNPALLLAVRTKLRVQEGIRAVDIRLARSTAHQKKPSSSPRSTASAIGAQSSHGLMP